MNKQHAIRDIFDVSKGNSKYTHKYALKHHGEYPVYSSQTTNSGEIFSIDSFDFNNEKIGKCLTWTTDGIYAGTLFIRDNKFSLTTHAGALLLKDEYKNKICLEYIYFTLKDILSSYALGEGNKRLTKNRIEKIKIQIPMIDDNIFDFEAQKMIVKKLSKIEKIKLDLIELTKKLNNFDVDYLPKSVSYISLTADKLFDLKITSNNSSFTKKTVNEHKGDIPVYGASLNSNEVGYGYIQDNVPGVKYFENCLTINRNGSAGFAHKRMGRFSISMDVTPLVLFKEYRNLIDLDYLALEINRNLKYHNFSFNKKAGKARIAKIEIKLPIDSKGNISLSKQKEIYSRFLILENIRKDMNKKLEILTKAVVVV